MHATKMYYDKRCSPHLELNSVISIIGVADRSAHIYITFILSLHYMEFTKLLRTPTIWMWSLD
jgi:hypothetical protein